MANGKSAAKIFEEMANACDGAAIEDVAAAVIRMLTGTYNNYVRQGYVDALLGPLQRMVDHINANVAAAAGATATPHAEWSEDFIKEALSVISSAEQAAAMASEDDDPAQLPGEAPPKKRVVH